MMIGRVAFPCARGKPCSCSEIREINAPWLDAILTRTPGRQVVDLLTEKVRARVVEPYDGNGIPVPTFSLQRFVACEASEEGHYWMHLDFRRWWDRCVWCGVEVSNANFPRGANKLPTYVEEKIATGPQLR